MVACCTCPVTPNGLKSLGVARDLISNTLTPGVPTSVVVKIYATLPANADTATASCNAASPGPSAAGLVAFGSTLHQFTPGSYLLAETPFSNATLSAGELNRLTQLCMFIQANGSGYGLCGGCALGGLGASRQ